jgi:aerobic-type carbon monoxide dehydrogenase small subunit (CoxS/CutS family)
MITFTVDGRPVTLDVPPHWTLLRMLRDGAGCTVVKHGCGEGVCGACAVRVDGIAVNACSMLAPQVEGASVETAAGLTAADGSLHPLQQLFVEHGAVQCGFCTPGMLVAVLDAVESGSASTRAEIRAALAGNLCRCTGYDGIVAAAEAYRDLLARGGTA